MKFLHIADVHLGCTRYNLPESPRDFYDAWVDVLERYAIGENVDFVIISGDFFHKRAVPPETMNYAVAGLTKMKDAGIPVVAIEGNHDQKFNDSAFSWLRSLASWGLIKLLEPEMQGEELIYHPWSESEKKGGYIDIAGARIFGSHWYGASANWAIPMLSRAITANKRDGAFQILLLHTDIEGHQVHRTSALSVEALSMLRSSVDYVALGHTHKRYEIDDWAFNPGSIEITNITEFREDRGAFIVKVGEDGKFSSRHTSEYLHRPFQRLSYAVDNADDPQQLTREVLEMVAREGRTAEAGSPAPIIEITLRGRLGFPNSLLEMRKIRESAAEVTGALHVRVRNHTVPADYLETEPATTDEARDQLERRVVSGLVARDKRFETRSDDVSDAIIGAKRMALNDEQPEKIADFIAQKGCQTNSKI